MAAEPSSRKEHSDALRAAQGLVFCCVFWAFSFPAMKALALIGVRNVPTAGSVFLSAWCLTLRFGFAALILAVVLRSGLLRITRLEFQQGFGLGVLGGAGLLLQMDGMTYTLASTSAFLTQAYCVWLPLWFAIRHREVPPMSVIAASLMVLAGGTILAGVDWDVFRLGRGEWETLLGSVFFAAQILWLDRPNFRGNHVGRFTFVMFAVMAVVLLPVAYFTSNHPSDLLLAYSEPAAWALLGVLTVFCTVLAFGLANRWQPRVSAVQAGLLYATEPVFTSVVCLVVPAMISRTCRINYPNEVLTPNLLWGGGLILAANILLQLPVKKRGKPRLDSEADSVDSR